MTETTLVQLDVPRLIQGLEGLVPRVGPDGKEVGSRAGLAALRRGLNKEPNEAPAEMLSVLFPLLGEERLFPRDDWVAHHVASLFALHPPTWPPIPREERPRNLGASLRRLAESAESDGPERRFVALLNSDELDVPHHLRGIVGLLRSSDPPIPVNWMQLTKDLLRWSHPEREVQRRWATSFWGGRRLQETPDESTTAEPD